MRHFWWNWPSPVVELLSGVVLTASVVLGVTACLLYPCFGMRLAVVTLFSLLYERFLDVNGPDLKDVAQREVGIVLAVILWGNLL